MTQALYRKWRPHLWQKVVGQDHITQTLKNAICSDRIGHAYLFSGPRGTGKTTTARLLAKAANCLEEDISKRPCDKCDHCKAVNSNSFLDLIEIDAASNTSVDDVRDLREKINFSPSQGRYKIYIIDEVHMLSTSAFNALLKTLEEPPPHAIFILATTEIHKIPSTVLSRCQRHEFRRIPVKDTIVYLEEIIKGENINIDADALTLIARQSTGSLRDAISLLDQLASCGEKISLALAQTVLGTATNQTVLGLVDSILTHNPAKGLDSIHSALDAGTDARQLARQVVEYLRALLLIKLGNISWIEATPEQHLQMTSHAASFDQANLMVAIQRFNSAASDTRGSWQPGLLLEMALAETSGNITSLQNTPAEFAKISTAPPLSNETPSTIVVPGAQSTVISTPDENMPSHPETNHRQFKIDNPSSNSPITLEMINQYWDQVKTQIKRQNPGTEALLNSIRTKSLQDGVLTLGFASETVCSKMEMNDHRSLTNRILAQVFGSDISVNCIVTGDKNKMPTPQIEIQGDSIVNEAINLGGKIVRKEEKKS
jgi:DNA polymerase-3 subunit gamma/tau